MTKNEIIEYLQTHKNEFMKKYQISKIALFGSYAQNTNTDESDVDIAIETPLCDYFKLYDFKEELETTFNKKVDIVRLRNKMNGSLKRQIEKNAVYV